MKIKIKDDRQVYNSTKLICKGSSKVCSFTIGLESTLRLVHIRLCQLRPLVGNRNYDKKATINVQSKTTGEGQKVSS